jgi:hypothetical protein
MKIKTYFAFRVDLWTLLISSPWGVVVSSHGYAAGETMRELAID